MTFTVTLNIFLNPIVLEYGKIYIINLGNDQYWGKFVGIQDTFVYFGLGNSGGLCGFQVSDIHEIREM
jgi:hypothetical protein